MKINTRSITLAATLTALCAVSGALPYVFFLPVAVAASTLSLGMVAFVGLAFGCISLAYSFLMPASLVSTAFIQAPYIAILPRIAAALVAFGVFKLMCKLLKTDADGKHMRTRRVAAASVSAAFGSIANTAIVVSLLVLIMPENEMGGVTMVAYVPTMLISGVIECVCMAVLTPPISLTLDKYVLKKRKKPSEDPTEQAAQAEKQAEQNAQSAQSTQKTQETQRMPEAQQTDNLQG